MIFSDIYGNSGTLSFLQQLLSGDKIPASLLLEGPEGTGKRTLARLYAMGLVCKSGALPCGRCEACKKAEKGIHPDIFILRRPEGKQQIPIEMVRGMLHFCSVLPNEADYRVCIIENAGELGTGGQNALLKILEEPPAGVRFVMTAAGRSQLLPTIVSRTLVAQTAPLPIADCFTLTRARVPVQALSDEALRRLCLVFEGCAGQVLNAVEDPQTDENYAAAGKLCAAVAAGDEWALAVLLSQFEDKNKDLAGCLQLMIHLFHLSLTARTVCLPGWREADDLCARMSTAALTRCIQCCQTQLRFLQGNMARPLAVSALSAGLLAN